MIVLNSKLKGVSVDSRTCQESDIFIGVVCPILHQNCLDAYQKGVRYFAVETPVELPSDAVVQLVDNARLYAAQVSAYFYPKAPSLIAAVTGTNGKSSTVSLLRQFWQHGKLRAASLGTLGLEGPIDMEKNTLDIPSLTSLDPVSFHKTLQFLSNQCIDAVSIEASSHGLDQYRLDGAKISVAAFTNLTQDHLDYHQTMENYFNAKAQLFSRVLGKGLPAVINKNSPYFDALKNIIDDRERKLITYGIQIDADFEVKQYVLTSDGICLDLHFMGQTYKDVHLPLCGAFQIENMLCAAAMAYASGLSIDCIVKAIPFLQSIKGRMEHIADYNGAAIFVDYAHTPDALENILTSIRQHTKGKVHLVFGCGGNRDTTKRPIMGEIANRLADVVYVTNDNPRFEDGDDIREQIMLAVPDAFNIADRKGAIQKAITNLSTGDVLIVAGKGHETGQIIKGITYPFSDQAEILSIVQKSCLL